MELLRKKAAEKNADAEASYGSLPAWYRPKMTVEKTLAHPWIRSGLGAIGWKEERNYFYYYGCTRAEDALRRNWDAICRMADELDKARNGTKADGTGVPRFAAGMKYEDLFAYVAAAYIMQERTNGRMKAEAFIATAIVESRLNPNAVNGRYAGALQIGPSVAGIAFVRSLKTVNERLRRAGIMPFGGIGYYYDDKSRNFRGIKLVSRNADGSWSANNGSPKKRSDDYYGITMKNPISSMMYMTLKAASGDRNFGEELTVDRFRAISKRFQGGEGSEAYADSTTAVYKWLLGISAAQEKK